MRMQQMLHGSAQMVHIDEDPLQNSTALGAIDIRARQSGLTWASQPSVYIPVVESCAQKQKMNLGNLAIQMPFSSLRTKIRTDIPLSELQDIDVQQHAQGPHQRVRFKEKEVDALEARL